MAVKRPATPYTRAADHRRMNDEIKSLRAQLDRQSQEQTGGRDSGPELRAELARVRETIARHKRDLVGLIGDGKEHRMARAVGELGAAVGGMETATDRILKSVEVIDESARALTATLQDDYKLGLLQDIQDHVVQIFESCNFQDLAGQRIGKVIATLTSIEAQVAVMQSHCDDIGATASSSATDKPLPGTGLLNGPKLDGDPDHACQHDIDIMFGQPELSPAAGSQ